MKRNLMVGTIFVTALTPLFGARHRQKQSSYAAALADAASQTTPASASAADANIVTRPSCPKKWAYFLALQATQPLDKATQQGLATLQQNSDARLATIKAHKQTRLTQPKLLALSTVLERITQYSKKPKVQAKAALYASIGLMLTQAQKDKNLDKTMADIIAAIPVTTDARTYKTVTTMVKMAGAELKHQNRSSYRSRYAQPIKTKKVTPASKGVFARLFGS